jgi:hypothetical protein
MMRATAIAIALLLLVGCRGESSTDRAAAAPEVAAPLPPSPPPPVAPTKLAEVTRRNLGLFVQMFDRASTALRDAVRQMTCPEIATQLETVAKEHAVLVAILDEVAAAKAGFVWDYFDAGGRGFPDLMRNKDATLGALVLCKGDKAVESRLQALSALW